MCFICGRANHNIIDCECTLCDYEEHEWNYGFCSYCLKECGHSSVENARCTICGYSCYGKLEEHRYDENLFCKICGYHDCESVGNFTDVAGGTDEACKIRNCHVCEKAKNVPHEYVGGSCNICSYTHKNHNWYYIADNYYHYKTCKVCYYDIPDIHDWENSVCTVCKHKCEGPHTDCECVDCDYENHRWNFGVCEDCGYEHEDHVIGETPDYPEQYYHYYVCEICSYPVPEKHEFDENSYCSICDYTCEHPVYNGGGCDYCGAKHNCDETTIAIECTDYTKHRKYCTVCFDDSFEAHTFVDDYCTLCGGHNCAKVGSFTYNTTNTTDDYCEATCTICNLTSYVEHKYRDGIGDCDNCGHYHQNHKNAKPTMSDDYRHSLSCEICGIGLGVEDHNYNIEQADDYDHRKICEDCDHVYFESHNCVDSKCTLCGYECVNHEINNCECSICDYEEHYYIDGSCTCFNCGKANHSFVNCVCEKCGATDDHDWSNNDGICVSCGTKHEHSVTSYNGVDEHNHRGVCDVCNCPVIAPHEFNNGVCHLCGYNA